MNGTEALPEMLMGLIENPIYIVSSSSSQNSYTGVYLRPKTTTCRTGSWIPFGEVSHSNFILRCNDVTRVCRLNEVECLAVGCHS